LYVLFFHDIVHLYCYVFQLEILLLLTDFVCQTYIFVTDLGPWAKNIYLLIFYQFGGAEGQCPKNRIFFISRKEFIGFFQLWNRLAGMVT